jgi:hypothetical protein
MTVIASTFDVPGVYGQGPGKGTQVLNAVAAQQAVVNAAVGTFVGSAQAQLNLLQIEAVDYFIGSYWVAADQILAMFAPIPVNNRYGVFITTQLAAIATRAAAVATLVAQGLPTSTLGNQAPQYSIAYLPYQVPYTYWYQLNTSLVDFLMNTSILPASLILSTMTGAQTYFFEYNTNGQFFSPYSDSETSGGDL